MTLIEPRPWPTGTAPAAEFCGEDERMTVMASFDLDALQGDEDLARIARFAARLCKVPKATVSLVESQRQRFLAREGTDLEETPRSTSFCAHTMTQADILEVLDATQDPRFLSFELVTGEQHLRYYAGAPLISSEGAPLGALCVLDNEPREHPLDEFQREGLLVLAEAVKRRLQAHRQANTADFALKDSAARVQFVLDSVPDIAWSAAPGGKFDFFNARWEKVTGLPAPANVDEWRDAIHPDDYADTLSKFAGAVQNADLFEDEWRLRQADGSYRYVLSRAIPSSDDSQTARWFGTLTDIDDAHRISQERELLAGELAHRIKNIFAVIMGLIALHARGDKTIEAFGEMLSGTIRALSRAQEYALKIDQRIEDELKALLGVLTAPYGVTEGKAVEISGDDVKVGRRAATPLALIFHELATNSAKYGALSTQAGTVAISIKASDDMVSINWVERNGPPVERPEDGGFGSRLVTMAVKGQLGGSIKHDWNPGGLRTTINVSGERLAE